MNDLASRPRVGVGVIVRNHEGKVLAGRRKGAHGNGTWSFPGGHLEPGESIEACAKREVEEETGLIIGNIRRFDFTNDIFEEDGLHYVTLFMEGQAIGGELELKEPEKCEGWDWYHWDEIPEPRFKSVENLIKNTLTQNAGAL